MSSSNEDSETMHWYELGEIGTFLNKLFEKQETKEEGSARADIPEDFSSLGGIDDPDRVPALAGGLEVDSNSSINVRWCNNSISIECSLVDGVWVTKLIRDSDREVVGVSESREEAIEKAKMVAKDDFENDSETLDAESDSEDETVGLGEGDRKKVFEEEVESILEDFDSDSVDAISEGLSD